MAEPERKTARSVLAYERGAQIAQRLTVISVLIGLGAMILGGVTVWLARGELKALESQVKTAESNLEVASSETDIRLKLNGFLTDAMVAISEARPEDAFGSELAYSRGFDELDKALAALPKEPFDGTADSWTASRQTIRRMMVGTLTSARRLDQAIPIQEELISREKPGSDSWANYSIGLAGLHCQAGDPEAAIAIVTPDFQSKYAKLLNDIAFQTDCGAASVDESSDPGGLTSEPALDARDRLSEESAPAPAQISRVFLHIRKEEQRPAAQALAARICKLGLSVGGVELVSAPRGYPVTPRAIYYYPEQVNDATTVSAAIQFEIRDLGLDDWNRPIDARMYQADNLPKDRVEIWLPPEGGDGEAKGGSANSCKAATPSETDIIDLARQLNDADGSRRLSAGLQIANVLKSGQRAVGIDALISQIEGAQLQSLSATGRFNVLYELNLVGDWSSDANAARLKDALANIESRAQSASNPVAIGAQTQDCIQKLKSKLNGGAAPNSCGDG